MSSSHRLDEVSSFLVMEILQEAQRLERQGIEVVHMEVGEPDFPTPACIVEAGIRALREGKTHYTHSLGLLELREAIAEHYAGEYGVEISPDQIAITSGSSPAMLLAFAALCDAGDEVILSDPYYSCYPNFLRFLGIQARHLRLREDEGYRWPVEEVQEAVGPRTRAIVINSPANPTGVLIPPEDLVRLAELGVPIVSDEIYHGLVYASPRAPESDLSSDPSSAVATLLRRSPGYSGRRGELRRVEASAKEDCRAHSILEFTDRAFVLNGFSKRYAMTGWRLGWVVAPREYVGPMERLAQNLYISATDFIQYAGVAALREAGPEVVRMREMYRHARDGLLPRLRAIGFEVGYEPQGAFYIFADARRFSQDSLALAREILSEAHVGVTPGVDFGPSGEGHLRFSYAGKLELLERGVERIGEYLLTRSTLEGPIA